MDSFRLVRYEMSTGKQPSCGAENILLQQRHNAAPGMVLVSKAHCRLGQKAAAPALPSQCMISWLPPGGSSTARLKQKR